MHVDEQQILQHSRELWQSQLGLSLRSEESGDGAVRAGKTDEKTEKIWSSCITVSGPWRGAILLECSESIARHAATMLFASDSESTQEDEIKDAINELAEMVGKKLRTLLPESSKLSRPSIVEDGTQAKELNGMQDLSEFRLDCEGRPVRLAFLAAEEEAAAAS